jgi:exodeoxyribonuclease VIII
MNAPQNFALGLLRDMPAEQYHAIHALSAGGLKRLRQSPAHFFGLQLDQNRPEPGEPSPAMKNGTLVHCALFEPDQVAARYVVRPADLDGRPPRSRP